MRKAKKRFFVALSFPGEHRPFVEDVAQFLSCELGEQHILYDKFHEAEFSRPNLDTHLQTLYHDESELVVVFLCSEYKRKEWPGLEWRAVRDLIKKREDVSIMFVRLDDAEVPGVFSIDGYLNAKGRDPREVGARIIDRLRILTRERRARVVLPQENAGPSKPLGRAPRGPKIPMKPITSLSPLGRTVIKELLFLLLLDQYEEGVWGRSLADTASAYGHGEDPGSITVSYWACLALNNVFNLPLPEISKFDTYVVQHQKPNGAVGMRKNIGSPFFPKYEIIENRRHTAIAASWWKNTGNALNRALSAIKYVIENRTAIMAWTAAGDNTESNADPLTTAYVLRSLIDFETAGLLHKMEFQGKEEFLATYRKAGMVWLHRNLIANDLWWPYRTKDQPIRDESLKRQYIDTANILADLPEFAEEFNEAWFTAMHKLATIWRENRLGIPSGVGSQVADLGATIMFTRACWECRDRMPEFHSEFVPKFIKSLDRLLTEGRSDAVGWALTFQWLAQLDRNLKISGEILSETRNLVKDTYEAYHNGQKAKLDSILRPYATWMPSIAKNQILPVELTPS